MRNRPKAVYMVLKISEICNITCKYCYFFFSGDKSYKLRPKKISLETVDAVADFILTGVEAFGLEEVTVSLHGGEPLMVGKVHFRKICDTLLARLGSQVKLKLDTQTNAMLVDSEWIEIFNSYGIGVGVSLDGPAEINDVMRIDKAGRGTHEATIAGIKALREAAGQGKIQEPNVVCVIGPQSEPDRIFDYFFRELGIRGAVFKPPIMDWDGKDDAVVEFTKRFFVRITDLWLKENNPSIMIRWLGQMLSSIIVPEDERVEMVKQAPLFVVRSDGVLNPPDVLSTKSLDFQFTGFDVWKTTMEEFLRAPFWPDAERVWLLPEGECRECKWAIMCRGGEYDTRHDGNKGFSEKSVYCDVNKAVAKLVYDYVATAVPQGVLDRRLATRRNLLAQCSNVEMV